MTYIFVIISALCCPFTEASSSRRPALLIIRLICSEHNVQFTAVIYIHKITVVDIAVLVFLTVVYKFFLVLVQLSAIPFICSIEFLAIFDTNTSVVRCTIVKSVAITVTERVKC